MYYIVCGTREEIIKERKEAGSSILERMRKARCRRKVFMPGVTRRGYRLQLRLRLFP